MASAQGQIRWRRGNSKMKAMRCAADRRRMWKKLQEAHVWLHDVCESSVRLAACDNGESMCCILKRFLIKIHWRKPSWRVQEEIHHHASWKIHWSEPFLVRGLELWRLWWSPRSSCIWKVSTPWDTGANPSSVFPPHLRGNWGTMGVIWMVHRVQTIVSLLIKHALPEHLAAMKWN